MKKLFVVLLVLALPCIAEAQCINNEVCVGANDKYDPTTDEIDAQVYKRDKHNASVCANAGLPSSCNQAAYDVACAAIPGCDASAIVYLATAAGVRTFFMDYLKGLIAGAVAEFQSEYFSRARTAWQGASASEREAACLALGKASDCMEP